MPGAAAGCFPADSGFAAFLAGIFSAENVSPRHISQIENVSQAASELLGLVALWRSPEWKRDGAGQETS